MTLKGRKAAARTIREQFELIKILQDQLKEKEIQIQTLETNLIYHQNKGCGIKEALRNVYKNTKGRIQKIRFKIHKKE